VNRILVAGVGSRDRRDDGVGPEVVRRASLRRVAGPRSARFLEVPWAMELLDLWEDASCCLVVDAIRTGAQPGTIRTLDLGSGPLPWSRGGSTHGLGVAEALLLARRLGRAPDRVLLLGIEGGDFGRGRGLSPAVERALGPAAGRVWALLGEMLPCA
jgi:hydrogenase maturation protease